MGFFYSPGWRVMVLLVEPTLLRDFQHNYEITVNELGRDILSTHHWSTTISLLPIEFVIIQGTNSVNLPLPCRPVSKFLRFGSPQHFERSLWIITKAFYQAPITREQVKHRESIRRGERRNERGGRWHRFTMAMMLLCEPTKVRYLFKILWVGCLIGRRFLIFVLTKRCVGR